MGRKQRKYYYLDDLKELFDKNGYELTFIQQRRVFEIRDKRKPENWIWLTHSSGEKVSGIRDATIEEWSHIMRSNIERIKQEIPAL
ncbi:MAG: hypothetical protein ACRC6N_11265 [Plesiomonas sp.]|uniref:hypothetical protein n=1 Tax=Plesiomonas sp. TaxID=2486279 RepID=UPI003F3EAA0D